MNRPLLAAVTALVCAGCLTHRARIGEIREEASQKLACSEDKVQVIEDDSEWRAVGCEREVVCDTRQNLWVCTPTKAKEDLVKERFVFHTGCPLERISKVQRLKAERAFDAFLLTACDAQYVCTLTPSGSQCRPEPPSGTENGL